MLQVLRPHQWPDLARAIERPEWADDPRFATPQGWLDRLESDDRPAVESWSAGRTKREACDALNAAGLVAGPMATDAEVVADPHLAGRHARRAPAHRRRGPARADPRAPGEIRRGRGGP
ncbi:MAG: CoA transferase [Acidimicrobiales bacterium]